jgi:hypothetical protein
LAKSNRVQLQRTEEGHSETLANSPDSRLILIVCGIACGWVSAGDGKLAIQTFTREASERFEARNPRTPQQR